MLSRCLLVLRVKRRSRRSDEVRPDHPEKFGLDSVGNGEALKILGLTLCHHSSFAWAAIAPSWWGTVDHATTLPSVALPGSC